MATLYDQLLWLYIMIVVDLVSAIPLSKIPEPSLSSRYYVRYHWWNRVLILCERESILHTLFTMCIFLPIMEEVIFFLLPGMVYHLTGVPLQYVTSVVWALEHVFPYYAEPGTASRGYALCAAIIHYMSVAIVKTVAITLDLGLILASVVHHIVINIAATRKDLERILQRNSVRRIGKNPPKERPLKKFPYLQ